mmetsp:Transcript_40185/g.97077  ORF Transcript_40185/g.97077 Transcript_40185/m.97077 type:complete len:342 (+) Transcript_40185:201-1226(+)|eukprot:CAMPEP_0113461978 /NCGR_PEP_ID=MMETSP0014_2-20120614/11836_1 /TAXON_ID=2857 /ORGANISM="Nitzschia sp." /LENGTH=341 /DNA_ID=CAMNT_0000353789 /DNA_START=128 /DNA_END=1153 /DNA_ORIENTATION=- /assembly_acc=CAM_ASM_000159
MNFDNHERRDRSRRQSRSSSHHRRSQSPSALQTTTLNEKLNTDYIVGADDDGVHAQATRAVTGWVGNFVTPRQLLIVLRILKAVTFCFLVLTVVADLMYIIFLEILATKDVRDIVGGRRDMIIRVYGLLLSGVAIAIETDVSCIVKSFFGFKGFVARAALLFFIANITGAHPLQEDQLQANKEYAEWVSSNQNNYNNNNQYYDDAANANAGDDDAANADGNNYNNYGGDDANIVYDDMYYVETNTVPDIPDSVIVFQMVTSFILGLCAITYFVFGLLCLDRFTSKAYLSSQDPLVSTAIPTPTAQTTTTTPTAAAAMSSPSNSKNITAGPGGEFVPPRPDA